MESIKNIIRSICCFSHNFHRIKTNYECEICRSSGNPPNILGKFIKINDYQVECNGCNNIFDVVETCKEVPIPVASCVIIRD